MDTICRRHQQISSVQGNGHCLRCVPLSFWIKMMMQFSWLDLQADLKSQHHWPMWVPVSLIQFDRIILKLIYLPDQIFVRHLWLNEPLNEAIVSKRLHHQLLPMEIKYESGFDAKIVNELRKKGHMLSEDVEVYGIGAVAAISRIRGFVEAVYDPRRLGSVAVHWALQTEKNAENICSLQTDLIC